MGRGVAGIPNEDPDRLKRVLDAKWRTIGIDVEALATQTQERKDREKADKERDEAFAALARYYDDQLVLQQQEVDRIRKQVAQDIEVFHQTSQLKHTRKEWDLSRPDHVSGQPPARLGDTDPRLGVSSLQVFEGEDLSAGSRKAEQMAQARQWWSDQAAHKAAVQAAQKDADTAYSELVRYQDLLQLQNRSDEAAVRREVATGIAATNAALAEAKRVRALADRAGELAANLREIDAMLAHPLLNEDPNVAASALSTGRVRKDHYRGMSDAEKKVVQATQLAQMEEHRARVAAAAAEEAAYARSQTDILRAMDAQAARVHEFKQAQVAKATAVLHAQRAEKAARDKATTELFTNHLAPEYFAQFGTSHR